MCHPKADWVMPKRNYFFISCNNNQNSDEFVTSNAITQPRCCVCVWVGGGGSYTKEVGHKREGRGVGAVSI